MRLYFLATVSGVRDTTAAFVAGATGGCGVAVTLDQAGIA